MYRGTIWGRTVRMSGSPLTLIVYDNEFGGDFSIFLNETLAQLQAEEGEEIQPNPVDFLKIAWVMARAYDVETSDFETWLDEFPDEAFDARFSLECLPEIIEAITRELIVVKRPEEPTEKDAAAQLPPEWQPYQLILSLKRMGFSMDEIRAMPMSEVIAYTDIWYSQNSKAMADAKPHIPAAREATPADIRKLLS